MNKLRIFTSIYGKLHNYNGIPFWLLTPFRKIVRLYANKVLPIYLKQKVQNKKSVEKDLIVSFTSFPARINEVWMVVETLKRQTVLPEKIILWLSKEQFPLRNNIPLCLREEEDEIFEIRMVDGDIRSHKKYYYAIKEFPEKKIITCDDDIIYHPDMIKNLVKDSQKNKGCIISNICKKITYDINGQIRPYLHWETNIKPLYNINLVQIGAGGVLYPPFSLNQMVLNHDMFMKLAPLADDLWLNCMARINNTPVVKSSTNILPLPIKSNAPTLNSVNCGNNKNDEQLSNLIQYFHYKIY